MQSDCRLIPTTFLFVEMSDYPIWSHQPFDIQRGRALLWVAQTIIVRVPSARFTFAELCGYFAIFAVLGGCFNRKARRAAAKFRKGMKES